VFIIHPTGNANARNAALAFTEAGLLEEFWTAIAPNASRIGSFLKRLPGGGELMRRDVPELVIPFTRQRPSLEILRLISNRLGATQLIRHETGLASVDAVYRDLDAHVSRRLQTVRPSAVYAYEDGALESFRNARGRDIRTIYDLPIGYWRTARKIAQEEADRLPDWAGTLPGLRDSPEKLQRKDEELRLADAIIVASQFTAATLSDAPFPLPKPLIIPYGCGEGEERLEGAKVERYEGVAGEQLGRVKVERDSTGRRQSNPLRVLFVGSLSQRKGIYELFRSLESLGNRVSLTLVGRKAGESEARDQHLQRHRWIPTLAHDQVLALMREHDVLVFPSLFEGFGLVITEALSQGIPVITTPHTAGPDVLTHGQEGFIVPIRDWEAIAAHLEKLDQDRDLLASMKIAALATARANPWSKYRQRLVEAVRGVVGEESVNR
jgi:alpha-maltose-1-phosphate synthase